MISRWSARFPIASRSWYSGRIVEIGPTDDVLRRPRHPYTSALLRAVPDLEGRAAIVGIAGQAPDPQHRPQGCAFAPRCGAGDG